MDQKSVPEITPLEFLRAVESGSALQVVDMRAPASVAAGRIEIVPDQRFRNVPGSRLIGAPGIEETGIDPSLPAVVVCARGNDSRIGAVLLNRMGADARSLAGGMTAWMKLSVPRTLDAPAGLDRLVQFDRVGKGALGYLLVSGGEAMIIDPPRDTDTYRALISESNARLVAVADTHVHADYVSGASRLAREHGVPYYLHPADNLYPYDDTPGALDIRPLADGVSIPLGKTGIGVVHTPGHSPGSVTYVIGESAAFTGDFLFITSVGRPDIAARTEEWSGLLWESIERVKSLWPAAMTIYPAHYGPGTGRKEGGAVFETFGRLLNENPSLGLRSREEFLEWVRKHAAQVPPAYRTIKGINVGLFGIADLEADELEAGRNECALGGT